MFKLIGRVTQIEYMYIILILLCELVGLHEKIDSDNNVFHEQPLVEGPFC